MTISTDQQTALEKVVARTAYFLELQFVTATQYLSSLAKPIMGWGASEEGTAQAGAASTLTLASAASSVDSFYNDKTIHLTDGSNRRRKITGYVGATRVATVEPRWPRNMELRSEEFDNASWIKRDVTVTADAATAPNGTMTAELFVETTGGLAYKGAYQQHIALATGTYTLSCYVKPNVGARYVSIDLHDLNLTYATIDFDLQVSGGDPRYNNTGTTSARTIAGSADCRDVGDGWFRLSGSFTISLLGTYFTPICILDSSRNISLVTYTGDGVSSLYYWGAQLEPVADLGNYVRTTSAAIGLPSSSTTYEINIEWVGLGGLGGISTINESENLDAKDLTFTLNAAQTEWLALAIGDVEEYRGQPAKLYFCPLDEGFQLIGDPEICWRGVMDTVSVGIEEDGQGKILLKCETSARSLKRRSSLRINAAQQKLRYPNDTGLDYLTDLISKPQLWLSKKFQQQ